MLLLYIRSVIFLSLAILVTSLLGCANSFVEKSLAPDPKLKEKPDVFAAKTVSEESKETKSKQSNKISSNLPVGFPQQLKYPNAILDEASSTEGPASKLLTRWHSSDPRNVISNFYLSKLRQNGWKILQQSNDETPVVIAARLNDTQVKISIEPKPVNNTQAQQAQTNQTQTNPIQTNIELLVENINGGKLTTQNNSDRDQENLPRPGSPDFIGPVANNTKTPESQESLENSNLENSSDSATKSRQNFNDIDKIPPQQQEKIQDLAKLGVLKINFDIGSEQNTSTPNSAADNSTPSNPNINKFEPAKNITRREYARWLITAYNKMYGNDPTKQIRLASASTKPVFRDVSKTDPDFGAIQGLAEAGIIPSSLSGDSTQVLFQPNSPLNREQLILWKVPLDVRQALPSANLASVKQTWGFQDSAKISSKALRAMLADFQNGDKANIRRVFGYTTLFQPKKTVTRAEAASALWYFGTEGEGVSAQDALALNSTP
ncbi:S-layer homology domain-containing protein [Mastigocoleus sp. MO_188.B34]|uniref:S-layer homology domain-containing protein n=1 Tax=Mastigocoleus sp. MO_188.B34 TaxID=3036635 RepID=UPI0026177BAC|nr:S-layer homology domain-containing protein [Mastigocoleus sp. MO_188.B34]MDJ0695794.1 S-layer homology domain-containing protein [Mastigocoleus sp. MO_188.B34]